MTRVLLAVPLAAALALGATGVLPSPSSAAEPVTYRAALADGPDGPHYLVSDDATGQVLTRTTSIAVDGVLGPATDAGPTVAYVSTTSVDDAGIDRLHLVAPGGSDEVVYTAPADAEVSEPAVSPDGRTLAFALDDPRTSALVLLDVASRSTRTVRRSAGTDYYGPSFSPDGSYLSWAQVTDRDSAVVTTRTDTLDATVVESSPDVSWADTAWSPDGARLMTVRYAEDASGATVGSLELVDLRDGTSRVVAAGSSDSTRDVSYVEPAWAPDGRSVLASRTTDTDTDSTLTLVRVSDTPGAAPVVLAAADYLGAPSSSGPGVPRDGVAPAPATGLSAPVRGATADLTMLLPADRDLADVVVTRVEGAPADTPTATTEVTRTRTGRVALPLPAPGTTYGVSVFSRDWSGNLAPAATLSVRSPDAATLTVGTTPAKVAYRTPVRFTGALATASGPVAAQQVELYARRALTTALVKVATATTGADGRYTLSTTPAWTAEYTVASPGGTTSYPALSAKRVVSVTPLVSLGLSTSRIARRHSVVLTGGVAPSHAGAVVSVQRLVGGTWRTLGSTRLSSTSSYRYALTPTTAGTWTLRVLRPADGDHLVATSPTRTLTVR